MALPQDIKISVIGLGYVGLPLAVEFGRIFPTLGLDINLSRLEELKQGIDRTLEVGSKELEKSRSNSKTWQVKR